MISTLLATLTLNFVPLANPRIAIVVENRGQLVAELYPDAAPKTVARFLELTQSKFYDGVRFHRVDNNPRPFIVVTGDPFSKGDGALTDPKIGTGGSGKKIPFEVNSVKFLNGTLGLVRDQRDRANGGDSQFFICNGNQSFLEGNYVAFGRVVEGLGIIPEIRLGDRVTSIRELKP